MIRRTILSSMVKALAGASVAKIADKKDVVDAIISAKDDGESCLPSWPGEGPTESHMRDRASALLKSVDRRVWSVKDHMRHAVTFDPDIMALKSCSDVYKHALQSRRMMQEDVMNDFLYSDNDDVLEYLKNNLTSLLKGK